MLFARRKRTISRILIVEDEPLVAFDNEHFLGSAGYEIVATVDTVAQAVEVIEADGLDLVLADISLSEGGNGIDVAHAARANGTPLLFVSGSCPVEAQQFSVGCLAKPYSQRDLLASIKAVEARLSGKPLRKPLPTGLSLYEGPSAARS